MRYLLIITAFVISSSLYAQTASEKKDQHLADEAAKKTALAASALSEKFDKHSASIKDVPEQFKDESVVILFNSSNYFIERGEVIYFVERVKTRVYLKDKAAVEKYSTYYTSGYGETNSSEVTIIKANGMSRTLELKDGIKETNYASVPLHYKSSVMLNETYYKFALPDLEPGDIIDFTRISKNPTSELTGNVPFTRIYLASDFPIVKTFLTIEVPTNDSYIYFKSLNGAPELVQKTGENGLVTFTLVDSLREKVMNDWNLPREKYLPHVKFIVTRYTGSDNASVLPIRSTTNKIKTEFSNEEWQRCANRINEFKKTADEATEYVMNQIGIQNPATRSDVNELMEMTWYYLRKKVVNNEKIMPTENISANEYDVYLATIFMNMLNKRGESFDLIFSTGNKSAGIKNVICPMEISWGIRWNDKYFMYPTCYMQYGELSNPFRGVEALIVNNFNPDSKTFEFKSLILTAAPYTENTLNESLDISLNENLDKILCVRTITATKGFSSPYISKYYNRDFNIDQLTYANMYIPRDSNLLYVGMNKTKAAELKRKNDAA
ncbi:MAG: hypothetical protein ACTHJT_02050 [Cytophaga sp.]|uniref:hypothetical protein n=1 Tax=Cytophaga sp. TaxID=29535 RepID=UPI003F7EE5F4